MRDYRAAHVVTGKLHAEAAKRKFSIWVNIVMKQIATNITVIFFILVDFSTLTRDGDHDSFELFSLIQLQHFKALRENIAKDAAKAIVALLRRTLAVEVLQTWIGFDH